MKSLVSGYSHILDISQTDLVYILDTCIEAGEASMESEHEITLAANQARPCYCIYTFFMNRDNNVEVTKMLKA